MTDETELDELIDESPAEAKAWFQRQVRTHGLRIAYQTAVDVCRDPKAAAPAKATAAGLLLRAAGVLAVSEDPDDIPVEQMTAAQMAARLASLDAEAEERRRALDSAVAPSVFD